MGFGAGKNGGARFARPTLQGGCGLISQRPMWQVLTWVDRLLAYRLPRRCGLPKLLTPRLPLYGDAHVHPPVSFRSCQRFPSRTAGPRDCRDPGAPAGVETGSQLVFDAQSYPVCQILAASPFRSGSGAKSNAGSLSRNQSAIGSRQAAKSPSMYVAKYNISVIFGS